MRIGVLLAIGGLALGGATLASLPAAEAHGCGRGSGHAHDCCQGHDCRHGQDGCGMNGMVSGQAPAPAGASEAQRGRTYDPDTVTTMRGTAGAVRVVPARGARTGGMHFTLESEGQALDVHLGPTWYLEREGLELSKGDPVEVTGSVVDTDDDRFLVARELKKGAKVLTLRDERGVPVWSGGRQP